MKIIKKSNKNILKLTKKEWNEIGKKAGWSNIDYDYEKEIVVYPEINGEYSLIENGQEPINAIVYYTYNPSEPPEYEGGRMVYPGVDSSITINKIINLKNNEKIELEERLINEIIDEYNLESEYKNMVDNLKDY